MTRLALILPALLLPLLPSQAQPTHPAPQVGTAYEIRTDRTTESRGQGSSGTSEDRDTIVERVIAVRDGGAELEYDLPRSIPPKDRAEAWQFPARVFRPAQGPLALLNQPELETRVDAWLQNAHIPRSACGHWVFVWNAFRIECDPQSVLQAIAHVAPPEGLADGAPYQDPDAREPAPLKQTASGSAGKTFTVALAVDTGRIRRERADSDVATGEMTGKPVSPETAQHRHAAETIAGTIDIKLETDPAGQLRRRTKVVNMQVTPSGGEPETSIVTETTTWRPLPASSPDRIAPAPVIHR